MEFTTDNREKNIAIVIVLAAMVVVGAVIISLMLEFSLVQNLIMSWVLTTFYSILGFVIVGDSIATTRDERLVYVDRPVTKEVIRVVDRPVEVIREKVVEKPVIQRVEVPVIRWLERKVYVKGKSLNIPKFNYIASSEAKTFHKVNCRFGKLIKRKYKLHGNELSWFKKKHFKACKVCLKKQ